VQQTGGTVADDAFGLGRILDGIEVLINERAGAV
jgi:hypothetical protein